MSLLIAFDLFGTLVELTVQHHPYRQAITRLNLDKGEIRRRAMTQSIAFSQLFFSPSPADIMHFKTLLAEELDSIRVFPDVGETLERLHAMGCRLCLISNLAKPYREALKRLPRHLFEAEILSFEVGHLKPAVEMYEAAAASMGCDPKDMIMVGDRLDSDVVGALSAGFRRAFWVKREGEATLEIDGAEVLSDLRQLPSRLEGDLSDPQI